VETSIIIIINEEIYTKEETEMEYELIQFNNNNEQQKERKAKKMSYNKRSTF